MKRIIRVAMLAAAVLGLVVTTSPSAQAETVSTAEITGRALLGGPLGLPSGTPPIGQHCSLPLPQPLTVPDLTPQCHQVPGTITRGVIGLQRDPGALGCTNDVLNVNKLAKPANHTGNCNFILATGKLPEGNHVHGFCGLSGGQVQVRFTDALGQAYTLDIHFNGLGGQLIIEGHWRKLTNTTSQTGLIDGQITAVADLAAGSSCVSTTATNFIISGTVNLRPHV